MPLRLEHANLEVVDIDSMIRFLQTAFPEFGIRHEGTNARGRRWVHIGTDETYISLNAASDLSQKQRAPYSGQPRMNHLGYEVDDVDALHARLLAAGYCESTPPNAHPHRKRVYFNDAEGNDWEFVQYFTDDPGKRNDYEIPDEG